MRMSFVDEMTWRGLIQQVSDERLGEKMRAEKLTLYSGFDPTAASFHVGSLMPIFGLRRAQLHGHKPIALVGGATGMIGDPSGKADERKLLSVEEIDRNLAGLRKQLARFVDDAVIVNNGDWFRGLGYLDFLRDVGKHFTVNHDDGQGVGARAPGRSRERHLLHRVLVHADSGVRLSWRCSTTATAAGCRSAAPTSGATSPPASNSSAASAARRPTR